jgi:hypothetical protein
MAKLARRFSVPRELPVAALVVAAALPLSRLFRPGGFTGVVLLTVLLSVGLSWVARRLRLPAVVGLLVSIVGLIWFVSVRFYPSSLWGIFPGPGSLHSIAEGVRTGIKQTIDQAVPVPASAELLMFVTAGVWLSAWLADAAAVWVGNPLLAIAATVPLFATPSTLLPSERRWIDTGLYLAAAAWVLFAEERAHAKRWRTSDAPLGWRPGPAVRVALIGVLVVVVMTPFLPGYGAPPLLRTHGPGDRIAFNPFVAIQATLRKQPEVPLFTVTTDAPTYMRLTTLEHYDGLLWKQGGVRRTEAIGSVPLSAYDPNIPFRGVKQSVHIQALAGPWIPASYDPVSVTGVADLKIETETRALVLPQAGGLPSEAKYTVTSHVPSLTPGDLDKPFAYDRVALSDYLETGGRVPGAVRDLTRRIAGDKPTPFEKVLALQNYLRTFTYDQNVAQHHTFKDITEFLTKTKRGYCEQFAASMALMARVLGIPSRVAIGFGFGRQIGTEYVITTKEAHAWVEIFFPDYGWVAFEPTPRADVTEVPPYATTPGQVEPSQEPSVEATPTPTTAPKGPSASHGPQEDPAGLTTTSHGRPAWVFVAFIAAAIVAIGGLVLVSTIGLRALRRRRAHDVRSASVVRYQEFLTWCAGAGLGRGLGETPVEHAARLGTESTSAVEPLERLARLVDTALWGGNGGVKAEEIDRAAEEARAALKETLTRAQRLLAAAGWGRWRPAA